MTDCGKKDFPHLINTRQWTAPRLFQQTSESRISCVARARGLRNPMQRCDQVDEVEVLFFTFFLHKVKNLICTPSNELGMTFKTLKAGITAQYLTLLFETRAVLKPSGVSNRTQTSNLFLTFEWRIYVYRSPLVLNMALLWRMLLFTCPDLLSGDHPLEPPLGDQPFAIISGPSRWQRHVTRESRDAKATKVGFYYIVLWRTFKIISLWYFLLWQNSGQFFVLICPYTTYANHMKHRKTDAITCIHHSFLSCSRCLNQ